MKSSSNGWYRVLFIILSIVYIACGLMLLSMPQVFAPSMMYVIGFMILVYGVMLTASYFLADNFKSIFTLIAGIVLIVLGLLCVSNVFAASIGYGMLAAFGFLIVGAFKIYQSFQLKDLGISNWWLALILGLANLVIACIMFFNLQDSGTLITILIGCNLLVDGVSDLMLGFMAF